MISPVFVKEQIALLDSIYDNPAYLEDHANPAQNLALLEETVAASVLFYKRIYCLLTYI